MLEVIEQPLQILLRIEIDGKEVLIPINESTLVKVDHKGEKIYVDLPEGLLDIYLTWFSQAINAEMGNIKWA